MNKKDKTQIALNLTAGLVLFAALGGIGSFWPFAAFNIIAGIMILYTLFTKGPGLWVWITKCTTYTLLCWKFYATAGDVKPVYVIMIVVSVVCFIAFKLYARYNPQAIKLGLWGQNIAYAIGGVMYILGILHHPESYTINHMMFWLINAISYGLLIRDVQQSNDEKQQPLLIVYWFAIITCCIYVAVMLVAKVL